MTGSGFSHSKKRFSTENLTIRQRIALFSSSLIFLMGALLVLFVNLISPIFIAQEVGKPDTVVLIETVDADGIQITMLVETPAPDGYTLSHDPGLVRGDPLTVVRRLSLIGLAFIVVSSYFVGGWIAKKSLQPITQIGLIAQNVNAHTLNQHLNYQGAQDEIKDLTNAFDAMLDRLESNFSQQSQFVSNLAHELRTPLTSLRMKVEVLQADPETPLEDYKELSIVFERALTRLERLIEDLLLLARGEMDITYRFITLGVLFEEILDELAPLAREHQVALRMSGDTDLEIMGDSVLLQRAFSNLVENGIYYNHPDGFVEITLYKNKGQVVVEIHDNGIGISKPQQAYIFERFYRAQEASGRNHAGKGIGLAITAHIIRLHQGRIEVESAPETGSIFRVFLHNFQSLSDLKT